MNRSEILQKLAAGELNVDEATRLLAEGTHKAAEPDGGGGVDAPTPPPTASAAPQTESPDATESDSDVDSTPAPRSTPPSRKRKNSGIHWLHIEVSDTGRDRVRVNVPVGLVRAGLWMGSKFSSHIPTDMWDKMMDALENDEIGTLVEVDDLDSGERVHIYVD